VLEEVYVALGKGDVDAAGVEGLLDVSVVSMYASQ